MKSDIETQSPLIVGMLLYPGFTFLKGTAPRADYITSVCTGSLILGVAGLLEGYQATSHW